MKDLIYFKTPKASETGVKLQEIERRAKECRAAIIELSNEVGFESWREDRWSAFGGISSCIFPSDVTPDPKIWKRVRVGDEEFMLRLSTKVGKELNKKFEALPRVSREELNMCIGFESGPFYKIGVSNNDDFFGIIIGADWGCSVPNDCTEVTYTEYKTLFKKTKED